MLMKAEILQCPKWLFFVFMTRTSELALPRWSCNLPCEVWEWSFAARKGYKNSTLLGTPLMSKIDWEASTWQDVETFQHITHEAILWDANCHIYVYVMHLSMLSPKLGGGGGGEGRRRGIWLFYESQSQIPHPWAPRKCQIPTPWYRFLPKTGQSYVKFPTPGQNPNVKIPPPPGA